MSLSCPLPITLHRGVQPRWVRGESGADPGSTCGRSISDICQKIGVQYVNWLELAGARRGWQSVLKLNFLYESLQIGKYHDSIASPDYLPYPALLNHPSEERFLTTSLGKKWASVSFWNRSYLLFGGTKKSRCVCARSSMCVYKVWVPLRNGGGWARCRIKSRLFISNHKKVDRDLDMEGNYADTEETRHLLN